MSVFKIWTVRVFLLCRKLWYDSLLIIWLLHQMCLGVLLLNKVFFYSFPSLYTGNSGNVVWLNALWLEVWKARSWMLLHFTDGRYQCLSWCWSWSPSLTGGRSWLGSPSPNFPSLCPKPRVARRLGCSGFDVCGYNVHVEGSRGELGLAELSRSAECCNEIKCCGWAERALLWDSQYLSQHQPGDRCPAYIFIYVTYI